MTTTTTKDTKSGDRLPLEAETFALGKVLRREENIPWLTSASTPPFRHHQSVVLAPPTYCGEATITTVGSFTPPSSSLQDTEEAFSNDSQRGESIGGRAWCVCR